MDTRVPTVTKPHSDGETMVTSTATLCRAYGSRERNERTLLQLRPLVFPEFPAKAERKALSFSLLLASNNENNLAMAVRWPWCSCSERGGASVFPPCPWGHPGAAPGGCARSCERGRCRKATRSDLVRLRYGDGTTAMALKVKQRRVAASSPWARGG
jgi:hypothetical protein